MSLESSLRRMRAQVPEMRALAAMPGERLHACHATTSRWCTAEHVDHMAKVTSSVIRRLGDPKAESAAKGISPLGRLILLFGWIPRGVGKAPERLRGARVTPEALSASLDELDALLTSFPHEIAQRRANDRIVPHPRFGGLTPAQAIRFTEIHNDHHFKIVRDVLARL